MDSTAREAQLHEFGRRVRSHREALRDRYGSKVSQEGLAELVGVHRTYIGHVERGSVNITLTNLVRIAAALEVDPSVLVEGLDQVRRTSRRVRPHT